MYINNSFKFIIGNKCCSCVLNGRKYKTVLIIRNNNIIPR